MKTSDFDYHLPKQLIAQKALKKRDNAKLLIANTLEHKKFYNILDYLKKGDVLVINEAKVSKTKLTGRKLTGAPAEIIIERKTKDYYECRVNTRNPAIGTIILLKNKLKAKIVGRDGAIIHIKFNKAINLKKIGELPQPNYIKWKISESEYQTIYAKTQGSVASPTAGLHFTKKLLKKIKDKGVKIAKINLNISFGTFLPITEENIENHKMHFEDFEISKTAAKAINTCKGRLISVGTTSLRALEAAKYKNNKILPTKSSTDIFITPGYKFKSKTKLLITNFHLPKSTLLLMVSAFSNKNTIKKAYNEAIKKKYRFYSLGDAMLLENSHPQ